MDTKQHLLQRHSSKPIKATISSAKTNILLLKPLQYDEDLQHILHSCLLSSLSFHAALGLNFQAFQEEVTTFNDRNDWLLAVNAVTIASPSWLVDFDYITTDIDLSVNGTDFDDTNGQPQINIAVVNPSPNFPSFIDAAPFVFTNDLDFTTTFAFLFVEADDNISVTMSFKEDNTFAWGGDFENTINGGEGLELELTFVNGTTISDDFAPTASDGFFGFTLKSEFLEQIRFKAASVIPGQVGEGFSFDNVAGANKEPSSAPSSEPSAAPSAGPSVSPSSTPSTEASAVENDDDDNFIA